MSNNTVYNVRARQTLSHGANVYELTQSTEKRSQFLISFWKEKKKKKGTQVKHFRSYKTMVRIYLTKHLQLESEEN